MLEHTFSSFSTNRFEDELKRRSLTVGNHEHNSTMPSTACPAAVLALLAGLSIVASADVANASTTPPSTTLILRVGTNDDEDRPAGQQSSSSLNGFRPVRWRDHDRARWHAAEGNTNPHWDQAIAERVTSGDLEMGLIPTRAWDCSG